MTDFAPFDGFGGVVEKLEFWKEKTFFWILFLLFFVGLFCILNNKVECLEGIGVVVLIERVEFVWGTLFDDFCANFVELFGVFFCILKN
jgi:hypothetical protein